MDPSASAIYLVRAMREVAPSGGAADGGAFDRFPARLSLTDGGRIAMPKDAAGLLPGVAEKLTGPGDWPPDVAAAAAAELLSRAALVVPHPAPSMAEAQSLVGGEQLMRRAKPYRVTSMLVVSSGHADSGGRRVAAGFADLTIVESAFNFGRSLLVQADISWACELDAMVGYLRQVRSTMRFNDAGNLPERFWFLGAPPDQGPQFQDLVKRIAAAYGVSLRCLPETGSWRTEMEASLRKNPPRLVFTWRSREGGHWPTRERIRNCVPSPLLVELEETEVADLEIEFGWRLAEHLDLGHHFGAPADDVTLVDWPGLREWLEKFPRAAQGDASSVPPFVVAESALRCCADHGNGYPDPQRMFEHVEKLRAAAKEFHDLGAQGIGQRFEDWVRAEYGVEVAMFPRVNGEPDPHIKVDDAKHGLAQAGRIHFKIDGERRVITLTYLGAHT